MAHSELETESLPIGLDAEGQASYNLDKHDFDASVDGGYSLSGPGDISGWEWTKGVDVSSDPNTPVSFSNTFGPIKGAGAGGASGVGGTACF